MQRKALAALVVSLFVILTIMPVISAETEAEPATDIPRPYPSGSEDYLTFQGVAKYDGNYLTADKLAGCRVVVVAAYWDKTDGTYYYTEKPCYGDLKPAEKMKNPDDPYNFSVKIPRITNHVVDFDYYLCVENGYKIEGCGGDRLSDETYEINPYPYYKVPGADVPPGMDKRTPTYNAYYIKDVSGFETKPIPVTGTGSHIITLAPAKVDVSGYVMSGKFALANVNIDLCLPSSPDNAEYTAITDKNGKYVITNVNTGTYIVKVHTNGYTAEDQILDVTDGLTNILDIEMVQNNTGYFGYDLPHFLLILGGVIGIILILASLFFQYWVVKKKHDNWVYNDMKDKDKED